MLDWFSGGPTRRPAWVFGPLWLSSRWEPISLFLSGTGVQVGEGGSSDCDVSSRWRGARGAWLERRPEAERHWLGLAWTKAVEGVDGTIVVWGGGERQHDTWEEGTRMVASFVRGVFGLEKRKDEKGKA